MNDDLRQRIQTIFERIEGGSAEGYENLLDQAIDEGKITQEEFNENEMAIADFFDSHWFYCTQCGWTFPVDHGGEEVNGELACEDCSPNEN